MDQKSFVTNSFVRRRHHEILICHVQIDIWNFFIIEKKTYLLMTYQHELAIFFTELLWKLPVMRNIVWSMVFS